MEHRIIISQPAGDNMGPSIDKLLGLLLRLEKVQLGDSIVIDITRIHFTHPILILPLTALIAKLRNLNFEVSVMGQLGYLETIMFPEGFNAIKTQDWQETLNYYHNRTYLPICQIPCGQENTKIRENLLAEFEDIMRFQLNITGQLRTAISYIISEAMANIVDHARIANGWIMIQYYPRKHFLCQVQLHLIQ